MVQAPSAEAIDAIRNAPSLERQITSLRQLKNDIVGHDQRKELVVKQGVIQPLIDVLTAAQKATGKRRAGESNGLPRLGPSTDWSREDEARLQAIQILGSLANGGRAFVPPLLAASTHTHLIECLSPAAPPKVTTAALQALKSLATSASTEGETDEHIPLDLFSDGLGSIFPNLQHGSSATGERQLKLAVSIATVSASTEDMRTQLTDSGTLDFLASLLASHAVAARHFGDQGLISRFETLPPPPPADAVPIILSAIATIIAGSNFRVQSFVLSPPMRSLFAHLVSPNGDIHTFPLRSGASECLLPQIHVPPTKSVSFNTHSAAFPALRSLQQTGGRHLGALTQHTADVEHTNAVLGWILFMARSLQGVNRLPALRLVALINNAIEASSELANPRSEGLQRAREREKQMSMLAVPIAVQLVQIASEGCPANASMAEERGYREIKEQACDVLAELIKNNQELQAAAVHAGAIKRVCPLLKKTFDNVSASKPPWSAKPSSNDHVHTSETCTMGTRGLPSEISHAMRCRQSALRAISALAKKEDIHRKAMIEAGVIQCIMDSLKPFQTGAFSSTKTPVSPKDGNTLAVLLAACDAARSMSRSVAKLRTTLIDSGVAQPIFELVKHHQNINIKIAATDVICNLILEFSPMKEDLVAQGAVEVLVKNTKGSDVALRLSSLWAVKHFVMGASKEAKMHCLEELGPGWLVGAIQGEHDHNPLNTPNGGGVSVGPLAGGSLSAPNAAGEQVDLLNPTTSMDLDEGDEDDDEDDDEESLHGDDDDGEMIYDESSGTHYQASQMRSTLQLPANSGSSAPLDADRHLLAMREAEQDPTVRAKTMDIAIQEQGLDFLRNLIDVPEHCVPMVDHLLQQIGSEKLFSLLTEKLKPIAVLGSRPLYYPPEIILAAAHVITHIAGSTPRHKSLLIAQTALLQAWLPHFTHKDRRVRVVCVWSINSLTWVEDDGDRASAHERVRKLRDIGIEGIVRDLQNDVDLDVRERVRVAVRQMEGL